MKCLLIGYGEIGKAVFTVYREHHNIEVYDPKFCECNLLPVDSYDILLVAIPYSDKFIEIVRSYTEIYSIKTTIVFSTVPIGTCSQIPNCVHSPVEGKHPELAISIFTMERLVGGVEPLAYRFFKEAGQSPIVHDTPELTEALKLLSTTFYGVCLEYYRYASQILGSLGGDGSEFKHFNILYNELYKALNMKQFLRPLLNAPHGELGGHCVVPNANILQDQYPNPMVKLVATQEQAKGEE